MDRSGLCSDLTQKCGVQLWTMQTGRPERWSWMLSDPAWLADVGRSDVIKRSEYPFDQYPRFPVCHADGRVKHRLPL